MKFTKVGSVSTLSLRIARVVGSSLTSPSFAIIRPHTCFLNAKTTVAKWVIQRSTSFQGRFSRERGRNGLPCAAEDSRTGQNSSSGAAIHFEMIAG